MILKLIIQVQFINTREDIMLINLDTSGYFILNSSLEISYDENLIPNFYGYLNGAFYTLTLDQQGPNIVFMDKFSGTLINMRIQKNNTLFNEKNYIISNTNKGTLQQLSYINIVEDEFPGVQISFLEIIQNSVLNNLQIRHQISISSSSGWLFGLAHTIDDNVLGLNIQILINVSQQFLYLSGLTYIQRSSINVQITLKTDLVGKGLMGLCYNLFTNIHDVRVNITSKSLNVNGVIDAGQGCNISNSFIHLDLTNRQMNVNGIGNKLLTAINCTVMIKSDTILQPTSSLQRNYVRGIGIAGNSLNNIIYCQVYIDADHLIFGGFTQSGALNTVTNSSFHLKITGYIKNSFVGGISGDMKLFIAQNIWIVMILTNLTGEGKIGGCIGYNDQRSTITNTYIDLQIKQCSFFDNSYISGLVGQVFNFVVKNISIILQIEHQSTKNVSISGIGYFKNTNLENIIVQWKNSSILLQNGIVSPGFLEIDRSTVTFMQIIGAITLNGTGSGLAHTMIDSSIKYAIMNINMTSKNPYYSVAQLNTNAFGSCTFASVLSYSLLFDVVKQQLPFNYEIFPMSVFLLDTPEANCYDDCATLEEFQDETFMKFVMNTGKFAMDDFNFKTPHLKEFYTTFQNGTMERNPNVQSPFGYDEQLNGIILGLYSLCGGDCHGFINPEVTICADGYSGEFCLELDCSFCQNGVCSDNKCSCYDTFYGEFCENSICEVCYQETCSSLSHDFIQCSVDCTDKCNGRDCVNNHCACGEGYIGKLCEEYNCTLDSNPCNKLGTCSTGECHCNLGSTIMLQNCIECPEIFNGICYPDKIECDEGFELPSCELFECQNDQICGNTTCVDGVCKCKQWFNQVNNYCVDICPTINKFHIDQLYRSNILNGIQHGAIYQFNKSQSNKIRSNLCVILCDQCICDQTACECPGVVQFINTTEGSVCNGCHPAYTGRLCDECSLGFVLFNNQCFKPCPTCHGTCYYNYENAIECLACIQGYQGIQCLECESNYVFDTGLCYPICYDCNGNCYVKNGVPICDFCLEGYNGPSCTDCDSSIGFDFVFNGCYQRCDTSSMGICYQLNDSFACTSCFFNLVGSQCNLCQEGFVMYQETCKPQIGPDQCFDDGSGNILCIACISDKILINGECQQRCDRPECTGECYFVGNDYKCVYCFSGIVINNKCYDKIYNAHGDCYQLKDDIRCNCLIGFSGISCEICDGIIISDQCYLPKPDSNGDCHYNALNENKISCFSCNIQYQLPECVDCSFGYLMGSDGKCSQCMPKFINTSTLSPEVQAELGKDACVLQCTDCVQGECYYSGGGIQCFRCKAGFTGNCLTCEDGYQLIGSYCLKSNGECNSNAAIDETLCINCSDTQLSFNCSFCSLEFTFDKCRVHAPIDAGKCFSDDGMVYCDDQEPCLYKLSDSRKCIQCNPALITMNDTCWYTLSPQNTRYRGECFIGSSIFCQNCDTGWNGSFCDRCSNSHTICPCNIGDIFTQCCCEITHRDIGLCFVNNDNKVTCNQCSGSLVLEDDYCLRKQDQEYISWVIPIVVILFLIMIITIIFLSLNKRRRNIIKIRFKRAAKQIGLRLFFVILAQIDSIIIALQDVYINDFFMQANVSFVSSFPFFLVLIVSQLPKSRKYYFNTFKDFSLFGLVCLVELSFHLIQYLAIPEQLEVGQQIYKLISPSVIMLAFIFLATYKFNPQQINALFIAISLPIVYQVGLAILDTETPLFFVGLNGGRLITGQIILAINIVILSSQYYLTEIVLSKYAGIDAITRLATITFLIYLIIFILYPADMIVSVLDIKTFSICVIMQMIFNVANIIIMMNISAVEFAINTISSALWVEFIEAIGNYIVIRKNYIVKSELEIIIVTFQMLVVILALIFFNFYSSIYNEKHNRMKDQKDQLHNGVTKYFGNRGQSKKQFYIGAKAAINSSINANVGNEMMKQYQLQQSQSMSTILSDYSIQQPRIMNNTTLRKAIIKNNINTRLPSFAPNTKIIKTTQHIDVANITNLEYKLYFLDDSINQEETDLSYIDQK